MFSFLAWREQCAPEAVSQSQEADVEPIDGKARASVSLTACGKFWRPPSQWLNEPGSRGKEATKLENTGESLVRGLWPTHNANDPIAPFLPCMQIPIIENPVLSPKLTQKATCTLNFTEEILGLCSLQGSLSIPSTCQQSPPFTQQPSQVTSCLTTSWDNYFLPKFTLS